MHGHVSVCALKLLVSRCCTRCRLSCQVSRLTCLSSHLLRCDYFTFTRRARKDTALAAPAAQIRDTLSAFWPRTVRYFSRGAGSGESGVQHGGVSRSRLCKVNRTAPDSHTSSREPGALAPSISALCRSISAYKSQAVSLSANRQVTRPSRRLKVSPGTGWRWLRVRRSRSPFFAAPRRTSSPPPGIGSRRPSARTPCCSSRGGGA